MKKETTKKPYQTYGYTVTAPNKVNSGVKTDVIKKADKGGKKA